MSNIPTYLPCPNIYFSSFSHTYIQFTILVLTWYYFTSYSLVFTHDLLRVYFKTGVYFVLGVNFCVLLIKQITANLDEIITVYYTLQSDTD